jgi:hypothetical protein
VTIPPEQPYRGAEFPPLDQSAQQHDPYAPMEYPTGYPPLPPPVYPQAGYPGYSAYDPYRQAKPPGTNGKAIGALVIALGGLMFCGLPSFVGLILGPMGMSECKRTGQDGYGIALAGTIIAGLITALWVLYLVVIFGITASGFQWAP